MVAVNIGSASANQFSDTETIALTGDQSVPGAAVFVCNVTPDTGGHTLTVPDQQTHQIINASATNSFTLATTGNSPVTVAAGEWAFVSWDVTNAQHTLAVYTQPGSQGQDAIVADGNLGATPTIDWSAANHRSGVVNASITTLTFTNPAAATNIYWTIASVGSYDIDWSNVPIVGPQPYMPPVSGAEAAFNFYFDGASYRLWNTSGAF